MKRKQLYILVGLLVILSVLCTLGFQLVTQYKTEFLFSLIGVTLADIVFFFHALAVMDEINDFKMCNDCEQLKDSLREFMRMFFQEILIVFGYRRPKSIEEKGGE